MEDIVGRSRLEVTRNLIDLHCTADSVIVEIGSNDASFRQFHNYSIWTTVDKYGSPDVQVDLDCETVRLPFDNDSVNVVVCTEVLEHLRMGAALVAEISRILRRDGVAVISVPNICSLKSRIKVALGKMPNMAASGDCGVPLGGTGMLVGEAWVGGHLVDFNAARLCNYLQRGGLDVTSYEKIPIEIPTGPGREPITLPAWLFPATFCDFVLVTASPSESGNIIER